MEGLANLWPIPQPPTPFRSLVLNSSLTQADGFALIDDASQHAKREAFRSGIARSNPATGILARQTIAV